MSTAIDIADITFYLHPDCSCDDGKNVEQTLRAVDGVITVHFDEDLHPYVVVYDDAETSPEKLIKVVVNAGYDTAIMTAQ